MEHRTGQSRKHLFLYLNVFDRKSGQLLGNLGDISQGGIMIITPNSLPLDEEREIRIKLPEDEEFTTEYFDVKVETRWQKPDVNPELHCIGCRFLDTSVYDDELIEKLVALLTFEG